MTTTQVLLLKRYSSLALCLLLLICCSLLIFIFKNAFIAFSNLNRKIVYIKDVASKYDSKNADDWYSLLSDDRYSTQTFFRHATSERNSSYPFVSGDTFRALADHIFDETTEVHKWPDRMWEIGRGDIVFLQSERERLQPFFTNSTFARIRHPFVLVTHNSDASVPPKEYCWALDDQRILAWFTQNPNMKHKKLFPIPIGVANTRWPHGNVAALKRAFYLHRKSFNQRTTLLYVNFQVRTNEDARSKALKWAHTLPNIKEKKIVSFETYLQELGDAKFVLSPPGNGLDCHRTWEALIMGAVPIVLQSWLDPLFVNESVIVVNDWNNITLEHLESFKYNPVQGYSFLAKHWYTHLMNAAGRN